MAVSAKPAKPTKSIGSVVKAMEVLETIARSEAGLGVTQISQQLSYGVSATYHLLNTLRQCGMVEQDSHSKKYRIGYGLFRLSTMARDQNLLGSLGTIHLERLCAQLNETVSLSVLEGDAVVCIAQIESRRMLRMFAHPGSAVPFYFAAGGKLLVALSPRETWPDRIARTNLVRYTPNTLTTPEALEAELEETARRGYGVDNQEREEGVVCVAAPVFDCYGRPVAAMSASGPAHRMEKAVPATAQSLVAAALELSRAIGYAAE